jgi:hypothetical protein
MDKDKTEVAWFFANERPRGPSIKKVKNWRLDWDGVTRQFDIKAKPVRWLGFFLDCRMNWRTHVKHRLALGHHRIRTMARIMTANGIRRKLARKVGWAVAMSTAAYGIELMWEGQAWLLEGFHRLSVNIGRCVAGTFSTAKGEDAIRAADIPPNRPWTVDGSVSWPQPSPPRQNHRRNSCSRLKPRTTPADTGSRIGSRRQAPNSSKKDDLVRPADHAGDCIPRGKQTTRKPAMLGRMDPSGLPPLLVGSSLDL